MQFLYNGIFFVNLFGLKKRSFHQFS